ncbi:hypothetical protein TKK_0004063 [Trichogramma kaykai]|uniref:Uncharacterized protein n=1 Tax=Trichogramma kaykai TaxID=54128 RepID=A0ABD2XLQ8_9HYME
MPGKKLLTKEKEEEHRNAKEDRDVAEATPKPPAKEPRPGQFVLLLEHNRRLSIAAENGHDQNMEMSFVDKRPSKYSFRMRQKHAKFNLRMRLEFLKEFAPRLVHECQGFDHEEFEMESRYLSNAPHANVIFWKEHLKRRDAAQQPMVRNNAHQVDDIEQQPIDQDNMDEGDAASSQSGTHKKKGKSKGKNRKRK